MKKILVILLIFISIFLLIGCSNSSTTTDENINVEKQIPESNKQTSEELFKKLNEAKEIRIEEQLLSAGKYYKIYIGNDFIGEVTGNFIKITGDVFEFKDANGKLIAYEEQIKRWGVKFNRNAVIYDGNDNITGYIGEEIDSKLFSIGYLFHFYDKDKNEIGISDQENLSLTKENNFYDNKGNLIYHVQKEFISLGDVYYLTVYDSSEVNITTSIFMVCIEDAINDANKK